MLLERYDLDFLGSHLLPRGRWRPFPPAADRGAWDALWEDPLNRERRARAVEAAGALLGTQWPALPATLYMEYVRTGNRTRYAGPYGQRRERLATLVMAECMEHRGRFLDEIINGLWLITEEPTWAVPAHARREPLGDDVDPLPRQGEETLALCSLRTALQLAETSYLLAEELDGVSPAVRDRVRRQILSRIVETFERHGDDHFWWTDGRNNWTPYCCTHLLGAAMHLLDETERLAAITHRLMGVVDRFIAGYGPDGGCDEGPGYWTMAAGAMFAFLEQLRSRSAGEIDIYDEPLIREMGLYITRVHLDGPWFANFADAGARAGVNRELVYRYGERVGSERMKAFAAAAGRWAPAGSAHSVGPGHLFDPVVIPEGLADGFRPEREVWLPDLQVMVTRDTTESGRGLVCAAKAGHNSENHNHNDVGQFILMLEGEPMIVDVGTEAYTRRTFSPERYTLWTQRSSGHNVPLVGGFEQSPGRYAEKDPRRLRGFRATDVGFRVDGERRALGMNLEEVYPEEAGIVSLRREIVHETPSVSVTDAIEMKEGPADLAVPIFTPWTPELLEPGVVRLAAERAERGLYLHYDPATAEYTCAPVELTDERLRAVWGPVLHRMELRCRILDSRARMVLRFAVDA